MSTITIEIISELIASREIHLRSTQKVLSIPIIERIFKKMKNGLLFSHIIVVEDLICDGHHRYIASLLAGFPVGQNIGVKTGAMMDYAWDKVLFTTDDWDTEAKIKLLNEEDADLNNITIDEIIKILA